MKSLQCRSSSEEEEVDAAAGSMAEFDYNLKSLKTGLSVSSGGKGGRGEGEPKKGTKKREKPQKPS